MDRHGIGRKMEREAMFHANYEYGWYGCWQPPRGKFTAQDIWGVFDFLAIRQDHTIVGVQVCQDRKCWVDARIKAINEWMNAMGHPDIVGYVMAYKRAKDGSVTWRLV